AGDDGDLVRAGLAVPVAVGADLVDVEVVMGVLDGGDAVAARDELAHQAHGKARLAGILPPGDAEDLRSCHRSSTQSQFSASSRSSGVLMLKKGSNAPREVSTGGKVISRAWWRSI